MDLLVQSNRHIYRQFGVFLHVILYIITAISQWKKSVGTRDLIGGKAGKMFIGEDGTLIGTLASLTFNFTLLGVPWGGEGCWKEHTSN